jgi:predicted nucleic acid-binding Zn ribbon protein
VSDDLFPLKDLLPAATGRLGIPSPEATGRVWSAWKDIVGPAVAAHADPTSLRDGVLRVRADSPAWATEIGYLVEEIRSRANAVTGRPLVSEVRVWTGPAPAGGGSPAHGPKEAPEHPAADGRERPQDPAEALERAHRAWSRRHPRGGSSRHPEIP